MTEEEMHVLRKDTTLESLAHVKGWYYKNSEQIHPLGSMERCVLFIYKVSLLSRLTNCIVN